MSRIIRIAALVGAVAFAASCGRSAKIDAVRKIYDTLGVGEEAKQEIIRLHGQALAHAAGLDLSTDEYALLENYAQKLIGRTK